MVRFFTFDRLMLKKVNGHWLNEIRQPISLRICNYPGRILQYHPPLQIRERCLHRLEQLPPSPTNINNHHVCVIHSLRAQLLVERVGSYRITNCCQRAHTAIETFRSFRDFIQPLPESKVGFMAILECAAGVLGWVLLVFGEREEVRHGVHPVADEIVHLGEHVAVRGGGEDGGEGVVDVVLRGGLDEKVSACAGAHYSDFLVGLAC